MPKYIDAEKIKWNFLPLAVLGGQLIAYDFDIAKMEAEDVAPIIHAKWTDNTNGTFTCSNCNKKASRGNYCPHCGAKMDEKSEDN